MTPNEQLTSALAELATRAEKIRKLGPDLVAIIDTDARNSSTRDGYPGGGNTGPRGNSDLTPTEAAANQRMGRRQPDEYHRIALNVLDNTERALAALAAILGAPDRVAKLQTVTSEGGSDGWCWVAQQHGLPFDEAWTVGLRMSDLGGLLTEPHTVCRWTADRARDAKVIPAENEYRNYLTAWAERQAS